MGRWGGGAVGWWGGGVVGWRGGEVVGWWGGRPTLKAIIEKVLPVVAEVHPREDNVERPDHGSLARACEDVGAVRAGVGTAVRVKDERWACDWRWRERGEARARSPCTPKGHGPGSPCMPLGGKTTSTVSGVFVKRSAIGRPATTLLGAQAAVMASSNAPGVVTSP